ncbi:MAG: CHAT domain-containing protein [Oscillatoria sp. Prado101]|nr:CHAT domain-containing protein [Oscillatoria sp. Prado101]
MLPSHFRSLPLVTAILLLPAILALPSSPYGRGSWGVRVATAAQERSSKPAIPSAAEADRLFQQGAEQLRTGYFREALQTYQQVLEIRLKLNDKAGVAETLNRMGEVRANLSEYELAISNLNQALALYKEVNDRAGEAEALNFLGFVYRKLGYYSRSLELHRQALQIAKKIAKLEVEGESLHNIAAVSADLGEYGEALELYRQALAIRRQVRDKRGEGRTLNNIAGVYDTLGDQKQALELYQQALAIREEIGDRAGVGRILNNIGVLYRQQAEYSQAMAYFERALPALQEIGDRASLNSTLNSLGALYESAGKYPEALASYQQALAIAREIGDKPGARKALSNIGFVFARQNQPELGIVFYKQAVNITESIRQYLRQLSLEQQESYTETVADTYRSLADLLLRENRVLEAQQVLDLLKVQELDDYLKTVRGNERTSGGVELLPQEQRLWAEQTGIQDRAIQLGKELAELQKIPPEPILLRYYQQLRRAELEKIQQEIRQQFRDFSRRPEVVARVRELDQTAAGENLNLPSLNRLRETLQKLERRESGKTPVVLYPLVLEDRLELVIVSASSPPIHRTVPVRREELIKAIAAFREALTNRTKSIIKVQQSARSLYGWLIQPVENDLAQASAEIILYAPDGQLRYIPLAALFDGKQWLAQRFSVNNITAASLTNFDSPPQNQPRILAGAFTTGSYSITVGTRQFPLVGLPFAGREVENLAALFPGTTKLLDRDFSRDATVSRMNQYSTVHLATHAEFFSGEPEDSFILFGDGSRATLKDVGNWKLSNVDLVVLSACKTGVGGVLGNGVEILGFGYQMQQAGARASVASLWSVDDRSTQVLMDAFYAALKTGTATKVEALRTAQISLIAGNYRHPYYWAPFILIGNGL